MIGWAERNDGYIFLALTAILLACYGLGWAPGQEAVLAALAVGVALLGLPHGSLDLLVGQRLMRTRALPATLLFAAIYLAIAAAYGLVWWWCASIGLASFLLISAVHFGSDWDDRAPWMTRLAYGLAVVTLPAVRHGADVAGIYTSLGVGGTVAGQFVGLSRIASIAALLVAFGEASFSPRRRDLAEFAGIVAAALLLPPLVYFGLYFCWLHSPRHLLHTARALDLQTSAGILRNVAAGTLAPLALAFLLFRHRRSIPVTDELTQLIFIGLAALTVPHMSLRWLEDALRSVRKSKSVIHQPAHPGFLN